MTADPAMTGPATRPLFDFAHPAAASDWRAVNDGVMGGGSDGRFRVTDRHTLEFFGTLSLANNGGFASVRSRPRAMGLEKGDVLVLRVRGDGRVYSVNLYLPRPLTAFSFRAALPTKDEWAVVRLPLDGFAATHFGRPVTNAEPLDPPEVHALGFLLGDKRAGPFALEVEWVRVERAGA